MKNNVQRACAFRLCQVLIAGSLTAFIAPLSATDISSALQMARQLNEAFIEVAEKVSPAVVVLEVVHKPEYTEVDRSNPLWEMLPPEFRRHFEEQERRQRQEPLERWDPRFLDARGSGIVIREDGYILTNTHVVEGAERIRVRCQNGKVYETTQFWTDPQSDVAVLKIEAKNLTVAKLADSSKTRVGEFAIAIGAPFELEYSVTFGHVSAKGRNRVIPSWAMRGASMDQDFIQTDASINPGNSGGPLVNIEGEVIGINTLIRGLRTGIGFAIPSNLARSVSDQLISEGKFSRAWLGIGTLPLAESDLRDLVKGVKTGLVVSRVETNGPAYKANTIKPGDIITAVDGQPVGTVEDLRAAVRSKKIGSELTLDIFRRGKKVQASITSEAWPEQMVAVAARPRAAPATTPVQRLGLTVEELTRDLAEKYGVELTDGVIITNVKPGSPAEQKGFRPGDIITEIDYKKVRSPNQFRDALQGVGSKSVIIQLISDGAPEFRILKDSGD